MADLNLTISALNQTQSNNSIPPPEDTGGAHKSLAIIIVSLVISIVGLLGNSMVILVIMKTKRLKERLANLFIVNQSAIDFLSSALLIFTVVPGTTLTRYEGWAGWLVCSIWSSNAFLWGLVFSSTYSLIALTLERYLSIVHPVWHKVCFSRTRAFLAMMITWIAGLMEGVAHSIPTSIIQDGVCYNFYNWPSPGVQKFAGVITCTLHYILPMFVLMYCYGKMILVISGRMHKVTPKQNATDTGTAKKNNQLTVEMGEVKHGGNSASAGQSSKNGHKTDSWNKARKNIIYTLSLISLFFALCWSMNQVYYLMMTLGFPPDYSSTFYNITVMAIHLNSCVNPFIYICRYDQFKTAALVLFGFRCHGGGSSSGVGGGVSGDEAIQGHAVTIASGEESPGP